jgi:hypothetical protein
MEQAASCSEGPDRCLHGIVHLVRQVLCENTVWRASTRTLRRHGRSGRRRRWPARRLAGNYGCGPFAQTQARHPALQAGDSWLLILVRAWAGRYEL